MRNDAVDDWLFVAEVLQRAWHRLVDDGHVAATHQLLELHQTEVGLDACGVTVHHEADGAGRCEHRGLAVAYAVFFAVAHCCSPRSSCCFDEVGLHNIGVVDLFVGIAVHAQYVEHVSLVGSEASEWPHAAGDTSTRCISMTSHHRGERCRPGPTTVRVVRHTQGHQECTDVGVAQAQLTEESAVFSDLFRWVVGVAHQNFLRGEHHFDGVAVRIDIERIVVVEVLEQVDRRQVARRVVDVHVFAARVRAIDTARCVRGVPLVDGGVELQTGVGALPRGRGKLSPQVAGFHRAHRAAIFDGFQIPVAVFFDGLHEVVGDAHGVVGVLILHRERVRAVQVHVETGRCEGARLFLFT